MALGIYSKRERKRKQDKNEDGGSEIERVRPRGSNKSSVYFSTIKQTFSIKFSFIEYKKKT